MAQQYLGLKNYSVIGGQFNTGDGIKMCQKVGADLWHMNVFEGGFGTNSCGYAAENGGLAHQVVTLAHNPMNTRRDGHRRHRRRALRQRGGNPASRPSL